MAAIFAFTCKCCGKVHEGSPSFGYDAPWHYSSLSEDEKKSTAKLDTDLCKIEHQDKTDYFIRTVLEVPIHGLEEPFMWGVWVSLSEKSFTRYVQTYDAPVEGEGFFGWVCNRLPWYADTLALPTDVYVRAGGARPYLSLHRGEGEHSLVQHLYDGIPIAKAQEIAEYAMHRA